MRDLGFVLALGVLLAVGAAIVIPNLLAPKICRNDTAAIATLRNLSSCQAQFQASHRADVDGDGVGEFGTFGEMTGTDGVRVDPSGETRGAVVDPPILSPALAAVSTDGIVTKSGYAFRIFLPGSRRTAAREGQAGWRTGGPARAGCCGDPGVPEAPVEHHHASPLSGPVDTDAAEVSWCAYAWPVAAGHSGTIAFFVDQAGEVWKTSNSNLRYSGSAAAPSWDAAMPQGGWDWAPAPDEVEFRGRDGNLWKRTN